MIMCLCVCARVCVWYGEVREDVAPLLHSDVTNTSKTNKVRHRIIPSCVAV